MPSLVSFLPVASVSDYRVVLGATIRKKRKRLGFSQEVLAEKADLHPNYFGRVERGEEQVSLASLRRIAKIPGRLARRGSRMKFSLSPGAFLSILLPVVLWPPPSNLS